MREILFRGKEAETGKWIYGWVFGEKAKSIIELDKGYIGKEGVESYYTSVVIPETVGQYTGLDDKYGVKIFEGDVLIFDGDKFVISWNDERCGFHMDYWMFDEQYDLSEFWPTSEIICNIHDNQELMGE